METTELKISKENALTAYQEANQNGKKLLSDLFGKKVFQQKITDRIKSFDDVITEAGITLKTWNDGIMNLPPDEIAYKQMKLITKVLNEGWVPDWSNPNQAKYYPWFKYVGSGSGFSYDDYGCDGSYSGLGSRLVFKSSDLAIYAGKQFTLIYNRFLN